MNYSLCLQYQPLIDWECLFKELSLILQIFLLLTDFLFLLLPSKIITISSKSSISILKKMKLDNFIISLRFIWNLYQEMPTKLFRIKEERNIMNQVVFFLGLISEVSVNFNLIVFALLIFQVQSLY